MISARPVTLYERVVGITTHYLGPAADRFIARQIQMHLDKQPEDLTSKDLEKLVDWIRLAMALLSEDNKMVDEFSNRLLKLAREPKRKYVR